MSSSSAGVVALVAVLATLFLFLTSCQGPQEGRSPGECGDGADNDSNGLFDCNDPGCSEASECQTNPADDDDTHNEGGAQAFEMLSKEAGLLTQDRVLASLGGAGAAVADVNSDGWPDLYLCGSAGPEGSVANRLFINDGKGGFVDELAQWGLPSGSEATSENDPLAIGATFADYDNDGDSDLFLANDGINRLFRNEGTYFIDHTLGAGLSDERLLSSAMVLGDYDLDGWVDLFVVHHQDLTLPSDRSFNERPQDRLYRNLGDGSFEDVTTLLPQPSPHGAGFAAAWVDVDDDGDLDLYVANDHGSALQPNQLYRNDGESPDGWVFTSISASCGCALAASAMGLGIGDYDRDGRVDLYVSNLLMDGGEVLLHGQGDGSFVDTSLVAEAVIAQAGLRESSWGVEFLDYDNDGWQDLFIAFGSWQDHWFPSPAALLRNEEGHFTEVAQSGTEDYSYSTEGIVRLDYDRDGCIDILAANIDGPPELYRNACEDRGNWLGLELQGTTSNREGIGARVFLYQGDTVQRFDVVAGSTSIHSSSTKVVHFGLNEEKSAERIEIRWPSGHVTNLVEVPANRYYTVVEGAGLVP